MPDDLSKSGSQDRERINLNQDFEIRDWSNKLGVSAEQLKEAVEAVGNEASKVEDYLRKRYK